MHRRVISVDIERAPADSPFMEDQSSVEFNFTDMIRKAGAAAGHVKTMIQKAKSKAQEAHAAFKDGLHSVKPKEQAKANSEVMSYLDEAEKHLESLERGMTQLQLMGASQQQQSQVSYMPFHAISQGPAMYTTGGQYYRM
jgi:hypothetical protein